MFNQLKTVVLLGALTGLIVMMGYAFGGQSGALIALVIAAVMNFGSYWFSDKIVLSMYKAREIGPSEHPELHKIVEDLATSFSMPKPRLYMVDMPVPNAFATGRNEKNAAVAVTSGIMQILTTNELRGVLAHELSHVKNKDILVSSIAATLAGAISYLAQMAYFGAAYGDNRQSRNGGIGAISMLIFVILTPIVASLLHLAVSRSREYLADETGAHIGKDPQDLASALQKLDMYSKRYPITGQPKYQATAHLFIVNPFKLDFMTRLFSTHPPIEDRIARLRQMHV